MPYRSPTLRVSMHLGVFTHGMEAHACTYDMGAHTQLRQAGPYLLDSHCDRTQREMESM